MDWGAAAALVLTSSVLSAIITGFVSNRSQKAALNHQQRIADREQLLAAVQQLITLSAYAHGRPTDGRDHVGVGEQLAAIGMIESLGHEFPGLKVPATNLLATLEGWDRRPDAEVGSKIIATRARQTIHRLGGETPVVAEIDDE